MITCKFEGINQELTWFLNTRACAMGHGLCLVTSTSPDIRMREKIAIRFEGLCMSLQIG